LNASSRPQNLPAVITPTIASFPANRRPIPLANHSNFLPRFAWSLIVGLVCAAQAARATTSATVTQHGITWTFDQARPTGQFVNGDWWVVGPVTVVSVSPSAGPAAEDRAGGSVERIYGASAMSADRRMRNGSMVSPQPGREQGYDSRLKNYNSGLSVAFPSALKAGDSLMSTISNEQQPVQVMFHSLMWSREKTGAYALKTAAVLTVVAAPPPADAFRPAYVGGDGRSFRQAKNLRWDILPSLALPSGVTPEWDKFARYLERPWIDHVTTWLHQHQGPSENQANYGREFSRITSIASLLLMLDVPRERKEKLMISYVQLGIDLHGLAEKNRHWRADGGHWNGRKWPMLFAGLMLGDERIVKQVGETTFSEDQQTYYGNGWQGATALYQMVTHTGARSPYEEKQPAQWDMWDKRSESYRIVVSGGLPGTALAAQLMKAKAAWDHDAFFDYYDRWMAKDDAYAAKREGAARPKQEGSALDPFVNAMWASYRSKVPAQPGARTHRMYVWNAAGKGEFVPVTPPGR
jgi:hypothetical protein